MHLRLCLPVLVCLAVLSAFADTSQVTQNLTWEYGEMDTATHGVDVVWPSEQTSTPLVQVLYGRPRGEPGLGLSVSED